VIGNDIIDLQLAARESNWQRRGYLDKIYTPAEQAMIHASADPSLMVWLLWSRKEAVYKIIHRQTGIRAYNPLKFNCTSEIVTYENQQYHTRSTVSSTHIHTIAVTCPTFFEAVQVKGSIENIVKDERGVPFFNGHPVSCSHHGRFSAMLLLAHG
jgi:phosphopantetheinyl transferase (holo-ACP synthase)